MIEKRFKKHILVLVVSLIAFTTFGCDCEETGKGDDKAFFKQYGWTVEEMVESFKWGINQGDAEAVADNTKDYLMYCNEISKDIGLDFMEGESGEITVNVYKIKEALPIEEENGNNHELQVEGMVIKRGETIAGAVLISPYHTRSLVFSLKGNDYEKVRGEKSHAMFKEDLLQISKEKKVAKYSPKKVIEEYINALDEKNVNYAQMLIQRVSIEELFNRHRLEDVEEKLPFVETGYLGKEKLTIDNIISAKIRKVRLKEKHEKEKKTYDAYVTVTYEEVVSIGNYEMPWSFYMTYEGDVLGWKINHVARPI